MWTDLCLGASVVIAAFIVAIVAPIVANAMVNAERERPHRVTAAETACPNDGAPASGTAAAAAMPEPAPHSTWQPPTSAAKVAPSAMKIPTSPAASIARVISARPMPSARAAPKLFVTLW